MFQTFIDQARGASLFGLNVLEWGGLIGLFMVFVLLALTLRDSLSGSVRRDRAAERKKNVELPAKQKIESDLPHGKETILIVDDDAAVLRAHSRLVSRLGYQVERANSGQDAIDYVRSQHADLIILDLLMPEMDGMETFRAIKKINPKQRAIVLSGFAGPAMVSAIKSLGVGTYLVKPAQVSMLARAIREELDRDSLN